MKVNQERLKEISEQVRKEMNIGNLSADMYYCYTLDVITQYLEDFEMIEEGVSAARMHTTFTETQIQVTCQQYG